MAEAFSKVIDAKSPFTAGHSTRVALYTDILSGKLGVENARRRWLKRGALLHDLGKLSSAFIDAKSTPQPYGFEHHDLGKLGVSNSVLDKPGALTAEEWDEIRMRPVYTQQILSHIAPFQELAVVAGAHHERLDGNGYPNKLTAKDLSLDTRIITTCDIFDAITAERPYRPAIPVPQALEIMGRMTGSALDSGCYEILVESIGEIQVA